MKTVLSISKQRACCRLTFIFHRIKYNGDTILLKSGRTKIDFIVTFQKLMPWLPFECRYYNVMCRCHVKFL